MHVTRMIIAAAIALCTATAAFSQDDQWDRALRAITAKRNAEAVALIDSGAFAVNMQNDEGRTLLHVAAAENNLEMVEALLARGADPSIRTTVSRLNAYEFASATMVKARLKQAMAVGPRTATMRGGEADYDKARSFIVRQENGDAVEELDKGLDIDMQDAGGNTLLHHAAQAGNIAMVRELIRRGANPNIQNNYHNTPADWAAGTMILAEIRRAGGKQVMTAPVQPAARSQSAPLSQTPVSRQDSATPKSPHAKMCNERHYSSSALCSDSTCKMREYRKWQTCLKTGSYY